MAPFEDFLQRATAPGPDRQLPGCAVIAANADGIVYSKCFGTQSVDPDSPLLDTPLSLDTTMWIASCTKLMTAISVLQCVERGQLDLDEDISTILSEWKSPDILLGFDDGTGEPILEKAKGKITLRMLLTHQSGMGYTFQNDKLKRFADYRKKVEGKDSQALRDMYFLPLLFEPGTSWLYSVGVDWAGQAVERVNNNQSLESYMQTHIWKPLDMTSTSFRLQKRPDIMSRRADMSMRAANGTLIPSPTRFFSDNSPDDHGGGGVYSCPSDYIKVLISLLKNDGTLLTPASVDLLFSPCLPPAVIKALRTTRRLANKTAEKNSQPMGGAAVPEEVDYALGGLVTRARTPGFREIGSMSWGGLPNLSWVLDRKAGIALLYSSQLLPSADPISKAAFERFEGAVYSGELGALRK